ncbi:MAG: type IX secretion system membrane protein PorP/SprF [Bacteroidota bacterium]
MHTFHKKIIGSLFILAVLNFYGQELTIPQFSQYLSDNPFLMSPTYAGIGNYVKVRASGLTQWVGIKNAPNTQSLSADVRLGYRSGVGMVLYNDSNGATEQKGAKISFAHHLTIDQYEKHFFSFALSFNLNQFRINIENFDDTFDPSIIGDKASSNPNFDVGFLYRKDRFYLSANVSNLLNKDFSAYNLLYEPNILRNYYVYTGYRLRRHPRDVFEMEPSVFFQYFENDSRSSTDFNTKFRWYDFEDYYYLGFTYRFLNDQFLKPLTFGPMIGLKKGDFYMGLSYHVFMNDLVTESNTFQATVGYDFLRGISNCGCTR